MKTEREQLKALVERAGNKGMDVEIAETHIGMAITVKGNIVEFMKVIRAEIAGLEKKK